ncbi:MAG: hypothetical protein AB8H86_31240 [Polyangiales bacterium]
MKEALYRYGAALLLAVVAAVQIVRAHSLDQSPWCGGGFGMFATVDGRTRFLRIVDDEGNARPVPVSAEALVREALVVVDDESLALLAVELRVHGVGGGHIEAWKIRFNGATRTLTPERMARAELAP